MLKLIEVFIIIKNATSEQKLYLNDDNLWTDSITAAKEFNSQFDARNALKEKLDEEEDSEFNVVYKIDDFLKTVYCR